MRLVHVTRIASMVAEAIAAEPVPAVSGYPRRMRPLVAVVAAAMVAGVGCDQAQAPRRDYATEKNPNVLVVEDFDGDGKDDIAVASSNDAEGIGAVRILLGDGDGFEQGEQYSVGNTVSLAVADFDADGAIDLASITYDGQGPLWINVLFGRGDGTFDRQSLMGERYFSGQAAAADFDEDGYDDLAVPELGDDGYPARIAVLFGPDLTRVGELDGAVIFVVAADADSDGHIDLVSTVGTYLGDGDGGFAAPIPFSSTSSPRRMKVGDLDGDGAVDLAFNDFGPELTVLIGDGAGRFGEERAYDAGLPANPIELADFDGDGVLDAAIGALNDPDNGDETRISLLPGDGEGGFGAPSYQTVSRGIPSALAAADFDDDGHVDLAATNSRGDTISVFFDLP